MFYKVAQSGGSYVVATLFDPETKEVKSVTVRDYDYDDCRNDNDEVYYMPINEEARKDFRRFLGVVSVGDTIKVVKGRKVPVGTIAEVVDIRDWRDDYGVVRAKYAYLSNGQRTNVDNCEII